MERSVSAPQVDEDALNVEFGVKKKKVASSGGRTEDSQTHLIQFQQQLAVGAISDYVCEIFDVFEQS